MWKKGIPDWSRKFIWLITIGNKLEITPALYNNIKIKFLDSQEDIKDKDI
jgi:hypothetical protein